MSVTLNVARKAARAESLEVRSLADGRLVAELPVDDRTELARKAAALRAAQPLWEALGPQGRGDVLLSWLDWIMDNEEHLTELIQAEAVSGERDLDTSGLKHPAIQKAKALNDDGK